MRGFDERSAMEVAPDFWPGYNVLAAELSCLRPRFFRSCEE